MEFLPHVHLGCFACYGLAGDLLEALEEDDILLLQGSDVLVELVDALALALSTATSCFSVAGSSASGIGEMHLISGEVGQRRRRKTRSDRLLLSPYEEIYP